MLLSASGRGTKAGIAGGPSWVKSRSRRFHCEPVRDRLDRTGAGNKAGKQRCDGASHRPRLRPAAAWELPAEYKEEERMNSLRRDFLVVVTLAAATPALGQTVAPTIASAKSGASIPDFSGIWGHPYLTGGFEQ